MQVKKQNSNAFLGVVDETVKSQMPILSKYLADTT